MTVDLDQVLAENARLRQVLADIGMACDLVDTETTEATQGWLVENIQTILENAGARAS